MKFRAAGLLASAGAPAPITVLGTIAVIPVAVTAVVLFMAAGAVFGAMDPTAERRQTLAEHRADLARTTDGAEQAALLYALGVLHAELDEGDEALRCLAAARDLRHERGESAGEAEASNMLGLVYRQRGEYGRARAALERARALREDLAQPCPLAETLSNLGLIAHHRGELDAAHELYRRALDLCGEDQDPELGATILINIGGLREARGESDGALELYERALEPLLAEGEERKLAVLHHNMGAAHRRLGEYQDAFEHYLEAHRIFARRGDGRGQARTLNSLGLTYSSLGEPRRALFYLGQSLGLRRAAGDRRGEATTLNNLGLAHGRLGDGQRALELYREALDLRRQLGDRSGEASSLDLIGEIHLERGDLRTARRTFEHALAIRRQLVDPGRARTLRHLAEVDAAAGDLERARGLLEQALDLERRRGDRAEETVTLSVLAGVERGLGHFDAALGHLEAALGIVESLRTEIGPPELRASFFATRRQVYEAMVGLHLELHPLEPEADHLRRAFEFADRSRGRTLLESLNGERRLEPAVDPDAAALQQQLERRLIAKAARQRQHLTHGRHAEAAALEAEIQDLLLELQHLDAEIRRATDGEGFPTAAHAARGLDEIRSRLGPEDLLLQYALGGERSFLFAATRQGLRAFPLPPRHDLESAARRLYTAWSTLDVRGQAAESAAAARLGRQLLGPLAARLDEFQRLVVIADGALHYVPFAALPRPPAGRSAASFAVDPPPAAPLIATHEVISLPTASMLAMAPAPDPRRLGAVRIAVMADPVFSHRDPRFAEPEAAGDETRDLAADRLRGTPWPNGGFERLPASRQEADSIARLLPGGVHVLSGFEARRKAIDDGRLGAYRVLHFATHGILDNQHPRLSGLVFSLIDEAGRPLDGYLPLQEIYRLDLDADLVVLSGCRTALGREVHGEGLIGLTRGFMAAGARRVVASLWRVQDRSTAELMHHFYRALLLEKQSPAAALRDAQLAMWRDTEWQDPYFWAAFVHQGDGR